MKRQIRSTFSGHLSAGHPRRLARRAPVTQDLPCNLTERLQHHQCRHLLLLAALIVLVEAGQRRAADVQMRQQLPRAPRVLRQHQVRGAQHPYSAQRDVLQIACAQPRYMCMTSWSFNAASLSCRRRPHLLQSRLFIVANTASQHMTNIKEVS